MASKRAPRSPMRKVNCPDCGYTVRMARSWMEVGMPCCPCGTAMALEAIADRAWCVLITADDVPGPLWTQICRENRWTGAINRKGAAAKAFQRSELEAGGVAARIQQAKPQCSYPGCAKWTAHGAEFCPHHDHAASVAAPF
jgi:hypothetical protein